MGLFRYEAVDNTGKVVHGVMDAASEQHVTQKLGAMGYTARAVYTAGGQPASASTTAMPAAAAQPSTPRAAGGMAKVTLPNGVPVSIKSKVSANSLAVFFRQLATLVRAGQPLYQASTQIRVSNRKITAALPVMQERIQSGQKLSSAMAEFPGLFPVHTIASVWCGELAGKLDIALDEIATDFEQEAKDTLWARVGWGLTKIFIIMFVFMVPFLDFNRMLGEVSGQGLPAVERYFTHGLLAALPYALGLLVWWEIWGHIKRVPMVRYALDTMLLKVPIWGKVHRFAAMARFFQVMDSLTSAGIYPSTAWDAASLTPRNSAIAGRLRLVRGSAAPDTGMVGLLERSRVFEPDDLGTAAAGERSGALPEVMSNLNKSYSARSASQRVVGRSTAVILAMVFQGVLTILAFYMIVSTYGQYLMMLINAAD